MWGPCRYDRRGTRFLMLEPDEINSVERQKQALSEFASPNSLAKVLFAFYDDVMIGYLGYRSAPLKRARHAVRDVAVGVLQQYQRLGAARALFSQAEKDWIASGKKVARLSVMEPNHKALALYMKLGFEVEGVEHLSLYLDSEPVSQKLLWKELS